MRNAFPKRMSLWVNRSTFFGIGRKESIRFFRSGVRISKIDFLFVSVTSIARSGRSTRSGVETSRLRAYFRSVCRWILIRATNGGSARFDNPSPRRRGGYLRACKPRARLRRALSEHGARVTHQESIPRIRGYSRGPVPVCLSAALAVAVSVAGGWGGFPLPRAFLSGGRDRAVGRGRLSLDRAVRSGTATVVSGLGSVTRFGKGCEADRGGGHQEKGA